MSQTRGGAGTASPFASTAHEIGFVLTCAGAVLLAAAANGCMTIGMTTIGRDLGIPSTGLNWIMSAFSLTAGCLVLTMSRLADMYGRKRVLLCGMLWLCIWNIVCGFATNAAFLDVSRAMQGMGQAAVQPCATGLVGSYYNKEGNRRNKAFGALGAAMPIGFIIGLVIGGVATQLLSWHWITWIFAFIIALENVCIIFILPPDNPDKLLAKDVQMDWLGAVTSTAGLVLLVFALIDAPTAPGGWATGYILALLVLGFVLVCVFVFVETRVKFPLLPLSIFRQRIVSLLLVMVFGGWSTFGILSTYATQTFQTLEGDKPFITVAKFLPQVVGGVLVNIVVAYIVGHVRGHYVILVGEFAFMASALLFALAPAHVSYFAMHFPALILSVVGADTVYPTSSLFIQGSLPVELQSLGGGVVNTVSQLSNAFGIALAATIEGSLLHGRDDISALRRAYSGAYLLGVGFSGAIFVVGAFVLRLGTANDVRSRMPTLSGSGDDVDAASHGAVIELDPLGRADSALKGPEGVAGPMGLDARVTESEKTESEKIPAATARTNLDV